VKNAVSRLRIIFTTIAATLVGVVNVATRRSESSVVLQPGDMAPDFALEGSDGRTYRLTDLIGASAVVLAWFPKAFTGG
jgi:peroxiredoxin Q/BCP